MVSAIQRFLPASVHFDVPQGGLFIWLSLLKGMSAEDLLPLAWEEGVDFALGSPFFPEKMEHSPWLRLNFVVQAPAEIEEGMKRLSKAITRLSTAQK